jgi:hypothetical protein
MKENILKRLKKYNTGGNMMADAQPIIETVGKKGVQTGLSRAFSNPLFNRVLGLGSGLLSTATAGYEFMKGYGKDLPNMGVNIGDLAGQSGLSAGYSMKQMGGVEPLPGGVAAAIPGSDAVEFMGNKHNESGMGSDSGIMLDEQTEVEDGETMDQVTMKHGGNRDYFFSSYLKKGGKSYADMHKNILAMGGSQEDINMLARMQEKAAGRDPKQVAKLGGVVQYQRAGAKIPLEILRQAYPGENILNYTYPDAAQQKLDKNFAEGNYLYDDDDITFVDSYGMNFVPDVMKQMPVRYLPEEVRLDRRYDKQLQGSPLAQADMRFAPVDYVDIEETEEDDALPFDTKEVVRKNDPEAFAKLYPQEAKDIAALNKILNRQVPTEAKVAFGAQFLPAIGAMLTKQKDPEQFEYTSGFTSPIITERVKGLKYQAPTQDEARARLDSSYLGQLRFLDTSGVGMGTQLANRQALFARKLQAEGTLGAQEAKDKLTAENLTKQSQAKADITNAQNELRTATANAQLIQREAARKQAVDAANTQLRNARENEKVVNRLNILNNLSRGIATGAGDLMAYKASDRLARATGQYGIYDRDKIKNALRNMPEYANTPDDELNIIVNNIMNKKG